MTPEPLRSPLLAGLDARGRADVRAAAQVRELAAGGVLFVPGEPADTLWFVVSGAVLLETRRGARELGAGEHFGTEALLRGAARSGRAWSRGPSSLLEIPVPALQRILARAGADAPLAKESALARRHAFAALLADTPFGQALGESAVDELVASAREEAHARGARLFESSAPASAAFVVTSGLVELDAAQSKTFAARGDVLGLSATLGRGRYGATATALGDVVVLSLSTPLLLGLSQRNPTALARAESGARARREKQQRMQELVAGRSTRHAFHELERLESARSLLAIDLGSCVRCGQCTVACAETHGTPRLARRGEQAVLTLSEGGELTQRALLFPHACQHCKDPACLPECPTGAITRDAGGAVRIHEDLCTGCGACAKACPWDAVRMAPRAAGGAASAVVASKCDLCPGSDGPECVSACPTGAIFRADPGRDLLEVRSLLGAARARSAPSPPRRHAPRLLVLAALVPPLVALARTGLGAPAGQHALATGMLTGVPTLLLLSHGLVKRVPAVRAWLRKRAAGRLGQRGLAPLVSVHAVTGLFAVAAALSHGGLRPVHGVSGALRLVFWLLAASGGFGALVYRIVPARLTRLERQGSLPEDHPGELEELRQRLYGRLSEQNLAVKELARRVLVPYAGAWYGPLVLIASGRGIGEEETSLAARVTGLLQGRKSERLAATTELTHAAVAIRALTARRMLERLLGAWLPLHVVLAALLLVLLALHVVGALG